MPLPVDTADELGEDELVRLFSARGEERGRVFAAADRLRREVNGDVVTYVVNRNIQYTNVCYFRCGFCAFSKGKLAANLRGEPYLVPHDEIVRRAVEAWERGATEVCLQGGIHPGVHGDYYVSVVRAIKDAVPDLHVHAFSALEVWQGAATLDVPLRPYLERLRDEGLASLPGTAAEILDDEIRAVICPDKITTAQWLEVHETAHAVGLRSNNTIMFGHVDGPRNWARHLLAVRDLQRRTGGFTEFVPLPFVHMEAPLYLKGRARRGPTFGEVLLMHAVGRLALHPWITNVQASWVKLGPQGVDGGAARGRERPGRDADERVDLALGRHGVGPGAAARADGGADPLGRAAARGSARRSTASRRPSRSTRSFRRRAARRAVEPARQRGEADAPGAARPGGGRPLSVGLSGLRGESCAAMRKRIWCGQPTLRGRELPPPAAGRRPHRPARDPVAGREHDRREPVVNEIFGCVVGPRPGQAEHPVDLVGRGVRPDDQHPGPREARSSRGHDEAIRS